MRLTLRRLRSELTPLYGKREGEAMIRLIFSHLKGWRPVDIVLHEDDVLTDYMRRKVEEILSRLQKHEPLQYILGEARFFGLDLKVTPDVLIPRPETGELVQLALDRLGSRRDLHLLDACTGSGCIAVALARNLPFPAITAIDLSSEALDVARENGRNLRVDIEFVQADALSLQKGNLPGEPWDAIVSNPPYIGEMEKFSMDRNVLDYEPHMALFVPQADPLRFYKAIARYGRETLKPGGYIFFEINPLHAAGLAKLTDSLGYEDVELRRDSSGKQRFLSAHI